MNTMTEAKQLDRSDHADRRRAPALRSVDPRDGLPPPGRVVQHRQEGRAFASAASSPRSARGRTAERRVAGFVPDSNDVSRRHPALCSRRRRAARRRLRPVHAHRLSGRARGRRVLPGLPVALRLLPQPAPHPGARRRRARFRSGSSTGSARAAACSTRSCSPAASPPRSRSSAAAIAAVRALGFEVGLHTGGAYPRRLAERPAARRLGRPRRQGAERGVRDGDRCRGQRSGRASRASISSSRPASRTKCAPPCIRR